VPGTADGSVDPPAPVVDEEIAAAPSPPAGELVSRPTTFRWFTRGR
jgi:hypothetical protein